MRVKFAVQVLSHTMASTIRTCVSTNELTSETASDTADFVDFMNRLFDCLNSRSLYSKNIYNCALSDTNCVKQFLINASSYFVDMYKLSKKEKITRPPCFNGFTQTINGVLQFFEDEKKHNISFLFTNRLNQDVLENLFSIFRQKGGYNRNPTSRVIRTSFRSTAIYSLVCTSKGTNCEQNLDTEVDYTIHINNQQSSITCSDNNIDLSDTESLSSSSSNDSHNNLNKDKENVEVTLEDCTVVYFAGYLAHICLNNFNCNSCKLQLITDTDINNKDQLFIINKNFENIKTNGLKSPSKELVELIICAIDIFEDKFGKVQHKKNIKKIFMTWFKRRNLIKHWLHENEECADHKLFILDKLLTCKIFKKCKDHSITTRQSKLTKLKILSHV
uniref:Transposable element P transposase n=1 Tax=Schizaphis graminum TaxID=13262 RepID=A0A2S2NPA0_SCHGA